MSRKMAAGRMRDLPDEVAMMAIAAAVVAMRAWRRTA